MKVVAVGMSKSDRRIKVQQVVEYKENKATGEFQVTVQKERSNLKDDDIDTFVLCAAGFSSPTESEFSFRILAVVTVYF